MTYNVLGGTLNPTLLLLLHITECVMNNCKTHIFSHALYFDIGDVMKIRVVNI